MKATQTWEKASLLVLKLEVALHFLNIQHLTISRNDCVVNVNNVMFDNIRYNWQFSFPITKDELFHYILHYNITTPNSVPIFTRYFHNKTWSANCAPIVTTFTWLIRLKECLEVAPASLQSTDHSLLVIKL